MVGRLTGDTRVAAIVAAPAVGLAAAWALLLAIGVGGAEPWWPFTPRNLSEAAAARDGGAVVRLVWSGADPNGVYDVRPELLWHEARRVPPIVAAAAANRPEIVDLLIDFGATPDAATWNAARCAASDPDVGVVLARVRRPGFSDACTARSE